MSGKHQYNITCIFMYVARNKGQKLIVHFLICKRHTKNCHSFSNKITMQITCPSAELFEVFVWPNPKISGKIANEWLLFQALELSL